MAFKIPSQPASFIGKHIRELPTPSFILSRPIIERNARTMLRDLEEKGLAFRPHVKTPKCCEATRIMLGGKHNKVVVSTLGEAWGLLPLVREGVVTEILYVMPLRPSALPELTELSRNVRMILLIDHDAHLDILEAFQSQQVPTQKSIIWDVFIKIDVGARRAGIPIDSPRLSALLDRAEKSTAVAIYGLYAYGGQSYDCDTVAGAEPVLHLEVSSLIKVGANLPRSRSSLPMVLSFGTTPTAHVITSLRDQLPSDMVLELHPGNYVANDLMQVATHTIQLGNQAARVIVEVCGLYPERNEAIVNAGVLALSKETSNHSPGFGAVIDHMSWNVKDISQEHGILGCEDDPSNQSRKVENVFKIGDKILLYVPHSCITAYGYSHYFVVDEADIVREVWHPWRGW